MNLGHSLLGWLGLSVVAGVGWVLLRRWEQKTGRRPRDNTDLLPPGVPDQIITQGPNRGRLLSDVIAEHMEREE